MIHVALRGFRAPVLLMCLALACGVSGCLQTLTLPPVPVERDGRSAAEYFQWLHSATEPDLAKELKHLQEDPSGIDPGVRQVKLALLLSAPWNTVPDEDRAMELLKVAGEDGGTPGDYDLLGRLWLDVLEERQLRRTAAGTLRKQQESQDREIQTLRDENDALRRQIEALKAIEQQLNRRERSQDMEQ